MLFMTPWYLFIFNLMVRRENGLELSLKFMKKYDYFVPCYYDMKKTRN